MALDLKKATSQPVILLAGSEERLRRDAYKEILRSLATAEDDLDFETYIADEKPVAEWFAAASTIPFLSDYRIVVVRNVARIDPREAFRDKTISKNHAAVSAMRQVPETGRLVLVLDDESGERAREKAGPNSANWAKLVAHAGGFIFEPTFNKKDPTEMLRKHADSLGKSLSLSAAQLLYEMMAGKLSMALAELDKLSVYVGVEKAIREEDIRQVATPESEYKVFTMVDAILEGRTSSAISEFRTMITQKSKVSDEAFSRIFPTIARQLRLLWQARVLIDHRTTPQQAPESILAMLPGKPNLLSEPDWLQGKHMKSARNLTLEQIASCFNFLVDADAKLKGIRPGGPEVDTVELMLLNMTEACKRKIG